MVAYRFFIKMIVICFFLSSERNDLFLKTIEKLNKKRLTNLSSINISNVLDLYHNKKIKGG